MLNLHQAQKLNEVGFDTNTTCVVKMLIMSKKRSFGELETSILRLFVKEKRPLSVSDVMTKLGKRDAYTTIMTVLSRLFEKGALSRVKKGRSYLYSMKRSSLIKRLKAKLMGARPTEIVSYFLEEEVELKEIEEIEKMIKEYKKRWKQ